VDVEKLNIVRIKCQELIKLESVVRFEARGRTGGGD